MAPAGEIVCCNHGNIYCATLEPGRSMALYGCVLCSEVTWRRCDNVTRHNCHADSEFLALCPPSPPSLQFMVVPGPETRDLTECCSLINLILQLFSAAAIRYTALHYYTIIKITPEHIYFPCTACLLPDPVLPPCGGDMRGQCRPPAADLAPPSLVSSHTPGS